MQVTDPKSPCERLGYKVGDKFTEKKPEYFSAGTVITLHYDDESEMPEFSGEGEFWFVELCNVTPYPPEEEAQQEQDEGWIPWSGGRRCPEHLVEENLELKFGDGDVLSAFGDADDYDWYDGSGRPEECDVVAYRFIDKAPIEPVKVVEEDGWITWLGGDCPVTDDHNVDLMFRDGFIDIDEVPSEYYWNHTWTESDIIKYRLTSNKAPVEPSKVVTEEAATTVATPVIKSAVEAPVGFEVNSQGGVKETGGKLRWTLLPIIALKEVVKVLEYGAKKYAPDNWQKVEKEKYKEALWRHWVAYNEGEKLDPETGLHHLAHLVCDALFILWFEITGKKDV